MPAANKLRAIGQLDGRDCERDADDHEEMGLFPAEMLDLELASGA